MSDAPVRGDEVDTFDPGELTEADSTVVITLDLVKAEGCWSHIVVLESPDGPVLWEWHRDSP